MASSSSSPPPPPPPPPGDQEDHHSRPPLPQPSRRGVPPPCWAHEETLALIDAYRLKWYSLSRGNLRASHWQEVADSVARRCRRLSFLPKTSVQCRHKIEKLRKRYRSEKLRPLSSWPYFRKMHSMESGAPAGHDEFNGTRTLHRLISNGTERAGAKGNRNSGALKRRGDPSVEMVSAIRSLGEGFMRMEQMKMEMTMEMERMRMEMEMKRTEMILESQRRITDAFTKGFGGKKTVKQPEEEEEEEESRPRSDFGF